MILVVAGSYSQYKNLTRNLSCEHKYIANPSDIHGYHRDIPYIHIGTVTKEVIKTLEYLVDAGYRRIEWNEL